MREHDCNGGSCTGLGQERRGQRLDRIKFGHKRASDWYIIIFLSQEARQRHRGSNVAGITLTETSMLRIVKNPLPTHKVWAAQTRRQGC